MKTVNLTDDQLSCVISAVSLADEESRSDGTYSELSRLLYAAESATWQDAPPAKDGRYWYRAWDGARPWVCDIETNANGERYVFHEAIRDGWKPLKDMAKWQNPGQWWPIPILMPGPQLPRTGPEFC